MFRSLLLATLVLVSATARAEVVVPLKFGETDVRFAVPDDYLRASEKAPAYFERSAAALPPSIRLVEALVAESDLKGMLIGKNLQQPYVQIQVMRDAEAVQLTAEDWRQLQPMMAQQLGATDLTSTSKAMQQGMNERMGKVSGTEMEVRFGAIGKPNVYSQTEGVIRYLIKLPISGTVSGQAVDVMLDCAGAVVLLNGKLLSINVYQQSTEQGGNGSAIRATLDRMVTRARALNSTTQAK